MNLKNRKGIVKIHKDLIRDEYGLQALKTLMSEFYPVNINDEFDHKVYYGYSEHFNEVQEGMPAHTYEAIIKCDRGDNNEAVYSVEFKLI